MDMQKIGRFLRTLRTEKGLTQEQLGQHIGTTGKTISRWETGTYMPPVECLKLLSDFYEVSINELLAGERLSEEDYSDAAEKNISSALKHMEQSHRRFERIMIIILAVTTILAMAIILLLPSGDGLTGGERIRCIIAILLVAVMAAISNSLNMVALLLHKKYTDRNS